jgi:signal transduction histidine kinase
VRDTGVGIPEDQHARVFEEFTQVEDGRNRRHEGTGLGLPLSKRLVELMSGRLTLRSEPGRGSEFSFTLPLA